VRFYNLKIGIPWADLEHKLDVASVYSLCRDLPDLDVQTGSYCMGVDTGKELHAVVLRQGHEDKPQRALVHLAVFREFAELDQLMEKFQIMRCVIDGLPETHATREFAQRHKGRVFLNFFNEAQRGSIRWDEKDAKVEVNRTEALDASREAVREKKLVIQRGLVHTDLFARHMACDAKQLVENEETGAKKYRYIRTGADHFSLAFTYAWMAVPQLPGKFSCATVGRSDLGRMLDRYVGSSRGRGMAGFFDSY
jgi:hypothetical protein